MNATDPDMRGEEICYDFEGNYTNHFKINKTNGSVYVTKSLDRDYPGGTSNWQINVAAYLCDQDNGPRGYGILNYRLLDINDNAPIFDTSTIEGMVFENMPAGTSVMAVVAHDWDVAENGTVSYTGLDIPQDNSSKPLFAISSTGVVTTLIASSLNREGKDVYYMKVRASDGGNSTKSGNY